MNLINCTRDCPQPNCRRELQALLYEVNKHLWISYKNDPEYLASADLYTIVILGLFASVIFVLMVRSIKPNESLDDQVNILLNSMRVRVEFEDNFRQKQKLQAAKRKAQRWLAEAKERSCKKLSFSGSFRLRTKSDSDALQQQQGSSCSSQQQQQKQILSSESESQYGFGENISMKSNPITIIKSPLNVMRKLSNNYNNKSSSRSTTAIMAEESGGRGSLTTIPTITKTPMTMSTKTFPRKPIIYQRAASYQFLPEIVVTSSTATTNNSHQHHHHHHHHNYTDEEQQQNVQIPINSAASSSSTKNANTNNPSTSTTTKGYTRASSSQSYEDDEEECIVVDEQQPSSSTNSNSGGIKDVFSVV